jgi:hypothetical protein
LRQTDFKYFYLDAYYPTTNSLRNDENYTINWRNVLSYAAGEYYVITVLFKILIPTPAANAHRTKYIPDNSISLGFKAGVSYQYAKSEKALNGDAMLEVAFSSAGGLDFIRFDGKAYMMATVQERASKPAPAIGTVLIQYDNVHKIFDANLNFQVNASGINGQANSKIHIEPQIWYVCVGRPSSPASLSLFGFGTASTYVLVGNQLEPMAPVPAQVSSLVNLNGLNNLRDANALNNATGFVGGVRIANSFSTEKRW